MIAALEWLDNAGQSAFVILLYINLFGPFGVCAMGNWALPMFSWLQLSCVSGTVTITYLYCRTVEVGNLGYV